MEKILSISEAFLMQPNVYHVLESPDNYYDKPRAIKNIELEAVVIGHDSDGPKELYCYVGYNFEGQKLFQFLANSMNVEFKTEPLKP